MPAFSLSVLAFACCAAHAQGPSLPPVTVTATRFPEDASRLSFSVSVLTADQLRDSGAVTVNDALMKLLGVPGRLDFYGGGDYQLDLRGFGSTAGSNQIIIVDGVRISEADLGGTRLAGISIDSVETIEVVRGGTASVLYGEGGTGGAIVITTKAASGKPRTSGGQGYLAMGSHSLLEGRSSATFTKDGFSLDAALNARDTNGHRRNFASSGEGRSLAAQWRNDWLRVGVRHAQDSLETGLPGALTTAQYNADPTQTNRPDDRARVDNQRNGVFAAASFGDFQVSFDAGQRDKALESMTSFAYAYNIEARNRSLRVHHSTSIGTFSNTVITGIDDDAWTRVVPGAFGSTAEQESRGVYVKDDLSTPWGTVVSLGLRRQSATKTTTDAPTAGVDQRFNAWNVGLVQPIGKSGSAYGNVGRSFRFPNVDEIGFTAIGATLQPQTSRDAELGVRVNWATGRTDVRLYRSALRQEIGYDPAAPGPFGPGANVNFDPTVRQGVELETRLQLNRDWLVWANAAARQAKFTAGAYDGNRIALTPRYTASVGADWKVFAGHKLGALVNTVSSQSPNFQNTCTMPAYTIGSLRYAFSTEQVELGVGVNNVTDKKYYTQAYGCAGGVPTSIYPEAGRNVVLSVRVSL
ncbi:TonB-dependent receptor [Piscinibacter sp. HJYY11]|uniref:TonB-dependent receptor n=1 Tax=Piscinibacter sp. HJYY11 TaxID=2801333 RepID=UPI00191EA707|nr:TonB-dependent receptor [Piscinibacter sp. HJYY11]MBL0727013.1 TonB-dependent receptor [Piscinibacter sp. HJYY11]